MACYKPLPADRNPTGGKPIVYSRLNPPANYQLKLPCGQCIGCRIDRATAMATRCLHESELSEHNGFLTLTYRHDPAPLKTQESNSVTHINVDNAKTVRDSHTGSNLAQDGLPRGARTRSRGPVHDSLSQEEDCASGHPGRICGKLDRSLLLAPEGGPGLSKNDHQKFIKRYRKKHGPLRYYMCGEYGKNLQHPHYHYLIFGHAFSDRYYWKTSDSGEKLYRSAQLEELWPFGHAWIGDVTYESCAYVAAYVLKKITGEKAVDHYRRTDEAGNDYWLTPEFQHLSKGRNGSRGIGYEWWLKFNSDVYPDDFVVRPGGRLIRPPRYYDKLLEMMDPSQMVLMKHRRELRAKELADDNTPARLADKETVTIAKMALKKRQLETQ